MYLRCNYSIVNKKALGKMRLRLGLGVGSALVPIYYPVIIIAVISTWYEHAE